MSVPAARPALDPAAVGPPRKRKGDPANILILLIALGGILAPVGGGTVVAMVWALRKLW